MLTVLGKVLLLTANLAYIKLKYYIILFIHKLDKEVWFVFRRL